MLTFRNLLTFWHWPSLHMSILMANPLSVRNASPRLYRTRKLQSTAYNEHCENFVDDVLVYLVRNLVHQISDHNELFPDILRF